MLSEDKVRRLKQVATTLNIGAATIVDYLSAKGFDVENKPTTKITAEQFGMLAKEFASSMQDKIEAEGLNIGKKVAPSPVKSSFKLKQVAKALDVEISVIATILQEKGYNVDASKPTTKISREQLEVVAETLAVTISPLLLKSSNASSSITPSTSYKKRKESNGLKKGLDQLCSLTKAILESCSGSNIQSSTQNCSLLDYEIVTQKEHLKAELLKERTKDTIIDIVHRSYIIPKETKILKRFFDKKLLISSIITPRLFHVFTDEDDFDSNALCQTGFSIAA